MSIDELMNEPTTIKVEAITLQELIRKTRGNRSKIAEMLGSTRSTVRKRVEELDKGKEWLIQVHRSDDGRIACLTWFNGDA